jgi:hypothetical protein
VKTPPESCAACPFNPRSDMHLEAEGFGADLEVKRIGDSRDLHRDEYPTMWRSTPAHDAADVGPRSRHHYFRPCDPIADVDVVNELGEPVRLLFTMLGTTLTINVVRGMLGAPLDLPEPRKPGKRG